MGWELGGFFGVEGLDKGICWANPRKIVFGGAGAGCRCRNPRLRIETWGTRGDFVGERGGRLGRGGVHRGSSRSKDALRMTARTDNDERTGNGTGQYRDSGCARMTMWGDDGAVG
jgi:hypothetical protein